MIDLGNNTRTVLEDDVVHGPNIPYHIQGNNTVDVIKPSGVFALLLPSLDDMESISSLICKLQEKEYSIGILLTDPFVNKISSPQENTFFSRQCSFHFDVVPSDIPFRHQVMFVTEWLNTSTYALDVVITLAEDAYTVHVPLDLQHGDTTSIRLSRADLPHCFWMSILSVMEWKSSSYLHACFIFLTSLLDWSTPRIDVSIITNNRPRSLERLLSSLSNGFFFGDTLNIRVNLEQSSDVETMRIAEDLLWEHGVVFVHHRVVHGGLLPAVVESWYPQSNDTYGLLLEDDIELSPLFYAWIKMTILRYR